MVKVILIVCLAVLIVNPLYGQDGVSLGLGGAYTALARGTESIYWNPANLAYYDSLDNKKKIKLYSFFAGVGNNSFSIDLYNKYNGKYLTGSDKLDILKEIPNDGMRVWGKADVSVLAFAYRNYGFSIEANGIGEGSIAKDAFDIILFGNSSGDSIYTFNSSGNGIGIARFNFSYGRSIAKNRYLNLPFGHTIKIDQVNLGATFSIIRGIGYFDMIDSHGRLEIFNDGLNAPANFRSRESQGGWGAGLDLGFSMITATKWELGFAFDNLLSGIRWSNNSKERIEQFDLRQLKFLDEISDLDLDDFRVSENKKIDAFTEGLPRDFRLGLAKYIRNVVLNGEWGRENDRMQYSFGAGLFIRFIHLYGGIGRKDSNTHYSGAIAFNLPYVWIDFGFRNRSGMRGDSVKGLTIANSIRFSF